MAAKWLCRKLLTFMRLSRLDSIEPPFVPAQHCRSDQQPIGQQSNDLCRLPIGGAPTALKPFLANRHYRVRHCWPRLCQRCTEKLGIYAG
jgi:hypothetical protein